MPKLRQPGLLQEMSFNVLLEYAVKCCDEHSAKNSLKKLRQSVAYIKENICLNLPRLLLTDFCNKFLDKFYVEGRSVSHNRAVIEIIMDIGISELRILPSEESHILNHLNPSDAVRLRGLETLYIKCASGNTLFINLEEFYLADLIELHFFYSCDDFDLKVIGKNCLKLKKLGIFNSPQVTKTGLRALNRLSELRVISVGDCPNVSLDIVHELLYIHKKVEKLFIYPQSGMEHFNPFSRSKLGMSVFPSVKSLAIPLECHSSGDLKSIAHMFPNLTSIEFYGHVFEDLRIYQTLNNLSILDLTYARGANWANVKHLFRSNGSNITELRSGSVCITQNNLDTIFKYCENIQTLLFSYSPELSGKDLSIPPFNELESLECYGTYAAGNYVLPRVKFAKMSSLSYLSMTRFDCSIEMIEEMILDNEKFPNLKSLRIPKHCDMNWLRKIVKYRNLDINLMKST